MNVKDTASRQTMEQATERAANGRAATVRGPQSRLALAGFFNNSVITTIALLVGFLWSIPTFGLFVSSFRPAQLINTSGWWTGLVPPWNFTIENYQKVLLTQGLGQSFLNSIIIAVPGTIFPMIIGALGAYALAWMNFRGRDVIYIGIIALMVIPLQIAMIPMLNLFTALGLTGQYAAVWLAHTAFGLPFSIYLLRNFFAALPVDLMESAHIDGASHLRVFTSVIMPLSVPALASLAIFQFMWVWNDLLIALIFLGSNPERAPLTLTVATMVNTYGSNYEVLTAAAFISMALPLVVFFTLQRYFVRGILAGSVKG